MSEPSDMAKLAKSSVPSDPSDPYADPVSFWREPPPGVCGPWNPDDPDGSPVHTRQEDALLKVLQGLAVSQPAARSSWAQGTGSWEQARPAPTSWPSTIFEAGCGFGRLTRFFNHNYPNAHYTGLDVGLPQLASARTFANPDRSKFLQGDISQPSAIFDLNVLGAEHLVGWFDLVLTSEVLMHIRPGQDLETAFDNLVLLTGVNGVIVVVEWVPWPGHMPPTIAFWNFPHDYKALFRRHEAYVVAEVRTDFQTVYAVRPPR